MSVVVVATVFPLPDQRTEVIAAFMRAIERVHAEDEGCELYALNVGDDRLVMVEKWTSAEALDAHARGPALVELGQAIEGKLSAPTDVQVLRPHPAGTADQGAI